MNLDKAIASHNKRVTYEWNVLMQKYGAHYDAMSAEGQSAACELAEQQGDRWVALLAEAGLLA